MATHRPVTRARAAQIAQNLDIGDDSLPSPNVSIRRPHSSNRPNVPTLVFRQPPARPASPPIPDLPSLPSGDWDSDVGQDSEEDEAAGTVNGEPGSVEGAVGVETKLRRDDLAKADDGEVRRRAEEMLEPYLPRDKVDLDFDGVASRSIPLDAAALSRLQESLYDRVRALDDQAWLHGPAPPGFGKPESLYKPHPSVALLDGSLVPLAAYQDDAESAFNPSAVTRSFAELGLDPRPSTFAADGPYGLATLGLARGYLSGAMTGSSATMDVDESMQRMARLDAAAGLRETTESMADGSMFYRSFSTSTTTGLLQSMRLDMA